MVTYREDFELSFLVVEKANGTGRFSHEHLCQLINKLIKREYVWGVYINQNHQIDACYHDNGNYRCIEPSVSPMCMCMCRSMTAANT